MEVFKNLKYFSTFSLQNLTLYSGFGIRTSSPYNEPLTKEAGSKIVSPRVPKRQAALGVDEGLFTDFDCILKSLFYSLLLFAG
jgi:hypothetical protein